jgi:uncharacterized membrane protein YphA (DoxX/SURF4 family)
VARAEHLLPEDRVADEPIFLLHCEEAAQVALGKIDLAQARHLVGLAQVAGGLAILIGLLTRIGAICVAIVMLGAIFLVHLPHGFDISQGGFEYALTQLLIAIALILVGLGNYSLASRLPLSLRNL